jgi:hypothetical protein
LVLSYGLLHQEADRLADIDWRMIVFRSYRGSCWHGL